MPSFRIRTTAKERFYPALEDRKTASTLPGILQTIYLATGHSFRFPRLQSVFLIHRKIWCKSFFSALIKPVTLSGKKDDKKGFLNKKARLIYCTHIAARPTTANLWRSRDWRRSANWAVTKIFHQIWERRHGMLSKPSQLCWSIGAYPSCCNLTGNKAAR